MAAGLSRAGSVVTMPTRVCWRNAAGACRSAAAMSAIAVGHASGQLV